MLFQEADLDQLVAPNRHGHDRRGSTGRNRGKRHSGGLAQRHLQGQWVFLQYHGAHLDYSAGTERISRWQVALVD
jgi:hypothetical protein